MLQIRKVKFFLMLSLASIFILTTFSPIMTAGQEDSFSKVQEKLEEVSEEKKEILQDLFVLVQEIEGMERAEAGFAQEIQTINLEIEDLKIKIIGDETTYEENRDILKQILKSYQKGGPGSYLEIILNSDSLADFLRRINTLRDLTRNTRELLESLEQSREKLSAEKMRLAEKLRLIEDKQEQLKESMAKKTQIKTDKEERLAALKEQGEYYQEHLTELQQAWDELKPLFSEITKEVSNIIQEGNLPSDALKITLTLDGFKGSIDEKTFNDIVIGKSSLPKMVFSFYPHKIEIVMPGKGLILSGKFVILEGHILKFEAQEGSFYRMPLEPEAIEGLFQEDDLVFNLKPLVGNNILDSVEIMEEHLEFLIKPVLFRGSNEGAN